MIRIVDILKKAEEKARSEVKLNILDPNVVPELPKHLAKEQKEKEPIKEEIKEAIKPKVEEKPKEETKPKDLSREELKHFFDEAFRLVEKLMKDKGKQAELLMPVVKKLIDQQGFGIDGIIDALDQYPKEKALFVRAFKIAVYSIKLGIDANYDQAKLEQLAVTAVFYDIEMAGNAAKGLVDNAVRNICANKESCENIINLAELYVSNLKRS